MTLTGSAPWERQSGAECRFQYCIAWESPLNIQMYSIQTGDAKKPSPVGEGAEQSEADEGKRAAATRERVVLGGLASSVSGRAAGQLPPRGKPFLVSKRQQLQQQPLPERTAHQTVQAMMVVEPARAEALPVTMHQAVERTRVLQQEFQEAL